MPSSCAGPAECSQQAPRPRPRPYASCCSTAATRLSTRRMPPNPVIKADHAQSRQPLAEERARQHGREERRAVQEHRCHGGAGQSRSSAIPASVTVTFRSRFSKRRSPTVPRSWAGAHRTPCAARGSIDQPADQGAAYGDHSRAGQAERRAGHRKATPARITATPSTAGTGTCARARSFTASCRRSLRRQAGRGPVSVRVVDDAFVASSAGRRAVLACLRLSVASPRARPLPRSGRRRPTPTGAQADLHQLDRGRIDWIGPPPGVTATVSCRRGPEAAHHANAARGEVLGVTDEPFIRIGPGGVFVSLSIADRRERRPGHPAADAGRALDTPVRRGYSFTWHLESARPVPLFVWSIAGRPAGRFRRFVDGRPVTLTGWSGMPPSRGGCYGRGRRGRAGRRRDRARHAAATADLDGCSRIGLVSAVTWMTGWIGVLLDQRLRPGRL